VCCGWEINIPKEDEIWRMSSKESLKFLETLKGEGKRLGLGLSIVSRFS
jgi:hypothetical protein